MLNRVEEERFVECRLLADARCRAFVCAGEERICEAHNATGSAIPLPEAEAGKSAFLTRHRDAGQRYRLIAKITNDDLSTPVTNVKILIRDSTFGEVAREGVREAACGLRTAWRFSAMKLMRAFWHDLQQLYTRTDALESRPWYPQIARSSVKANKERVPAKVHLYGVA